MQIRAFLDVLRRRLALMVVCVLVVTSLAALATFLMTPVYQSTSRLYVSAAQADTGEAYAGGLLSEQRVAAYVEIVESSLLATRVHDQLDLADSAEEIDRKVSANTVGETPVLEIHVKDANADLAQLLSQTYAEQLVSAAAEIESPRGDKGTPVTVTIIDPATSPASPVFPKPVLNLTLALILGLVLAVAVALLREVLDNTIKQVEDLGPEGPPLLGALVAESAKDHATIVSQLPQSAPRVEAFRMLRTNISFVDIDQPNKVLVVTSPMQGDGKTSVAVNLAVSLATAQVRTLLIDGDLRRPKVAASLNLVDDVGVTTVLRGRVSLEDAIQRYRSGGLEVLTAGTPPPNAAELLQSDAMEKLLDHVRTSYEVVIIDSPPLLPVTDAALLAARADGAVVVLRHGRTTKEQWRETQSRLEQVDATTLGVVMNMVPSSDATSGYAYGSYKPQPTPRGQRRSK
ncbi:tyrosine-protein kinase domain-containing protein [Nocardioides dilutus]